MIRWVCSGCNKKWMFPVDRCVHCKGEIKKIVGTKFKVVGFTTVHVNSTSHMDVPYNIALIEDEHGNKMPKKTAESYEIGDEFLFEKKDVAVVNVKYDMYEAVKLALSMIDPIESKVCMRKDEMVDVELVDAVAKVLKEKGVEMCGNGGLVVNVVMLPTKSDGGLIISCFKRNGFSDAVVAGYDTAAVNNAAGHSEVIEGVDVDSNKGKSILGRILNKLGVG